MAAMHRMGNWGITNGEPPQVKGSNQLLEQLSLSRYLAKGVSGYAAYANRHSAYEGTDYFELRFTPARVAYVDLFSHLRLYIESFEAFELFIQGEDLAGIHSETFPQVNSRCKVVHLSPTHYMADGVCRNSFGMPAEEVYKRLSAHEKVERVERILDGVLIVSSTKILSLREQADCGRVLREALGLPPVNKWEGWAAPIMSIARDIINQKTSVIAGSRAIVTAVPGPPPEYAGDSDFQVFQEVTDAVKTFPAEYQRGQYHPDYLKIVDRKVGELLNRMTEPVMEACESIVERFGDGS